MQILPQFLDGEIKSLRMQHETAPLPPGAECKLDSLYGQDWRLWATSTDTLPEPSVLLVHDLALAMPTTQLIVGAQESQLLRLGQLLAQWGIGDRIRLIATPSASMWVRDPGVHLSVAGKLAMLCPASFRPEDPRPSHSAGEQALAVMAQAIGLPIRRSRFLFEGGDVLATKRHAFIGRNTLERNARYLSIPKDTLVAGLQEDFQVPVEVISAPTFHLDLCLSFPQERVAFLADPWRGVWLAQRALAREPMAIWAREELKAMTRTTVTRDLSALRSIRERLRQLGYQVVGVPFLHGLGDSSANPKIKRTAIASFHNGLFFTEGQTPVAVLGSSGHPFLDHVAGKIHTSYGSQVRWVPAAAISSMLQGGVRCATVELAVA